MVSGLGLGTGPSPFSGCSGISQTFNVSGVPAGCTYTISDLSCGLVQVRGGTSGCLPSGTTYVWKGSKHTSASAPTNVSNYTFTDGLDNEMVTVTITNATTCLSATQTNGPFISSPATCRRAAVGSSKLSVYLNSGKDILLIQLPLTMPGDLKATPTGLCAGQALSVTFTRIGPFASAEQAVAVQLSNAHGRFRPGEVRVLAQGTASPLALTLPADLPTGTGYRLRVIRPDSTVLGGDNGQDLTITALATASINPAGPTLSVCQGSSLTLAAPAGFAQYLWSTGATTRTLSVSAAGSYTVRVAAVTGCLGPASAAVTVQVLPVPAAPVVQQLASGQLAVAAPVAGASYQWLLGGTPLAGATGPTYPATGGPVPAAGSYTVITTVQGCASPPSAALAVVLAVAVAQAGPDLLVYPNPATQAVTVRWSGQLEPATLTLLDALGREVRMARLRDRQAQLALARLPPGVYAVRVHRSRGGSAAAAAYCGSLSRPLCRLAR